MTKSKALNFSRKIKTKPSKLTREIYLLLCLFYEQRFCISYVLLLFDISVRTLERDIHEIHSLYPVDGYDFDFDGDTFKHIEGSKRQWTAYPPRTMQQKVHMDRLCRIYKMLKSYEGEIDDYTRNITDFIMFDSLKKNNQDETIYTKLHAGVWFDESTTVAEKRRIQRDYKELANAIDLFKHTYD